MKSGRIWKSVGITLADKLPGPVILKENSRGVRYIIFAWRICALVQQCQWRRATSRCLSQAANEQSSLAYISLIKSKPEDHTHLILSAIACALNLLPFLYSLTTTSPNDPPRPFSATFLLSCKYFVTRPYKSLALTQTPHPTFSFLFTNSPHSGRSSISKHEKENKLLLVKTSNLEYKYLLFVF